MDAHLLVETENENGDTHCQREWSDMKSDEMDKKLDESCTMTCGSHLEHSVLFHG